MKIRFIFLEYISDATWLNPFYNLVLSVSTIGHALMNIVAHLTRLLRSTQLLLIVP